MYVYLWDKMSIIADGGNKMENNWTINQTKELFSLVKKTADEQTGLKKAFTVMAEKSGRSLNSVRNYYYSQLKMFELVPKLAEDLGIELVNSRREEFELFTKEEIDELLRQILVGKAKGVSVRGVISSMAHNDKEALRLQNKYRSMVTHHKSEVTAVMNRLAAQKIPYYNPYIKKVIDGSNGDNIARLNEYVSKLDVDEVAGFLNLLGKLI